MSTRVLIDRELADVPELLQKEVYDFAYFLKSKTRDEALNGQLLSERVLAKEWDTPEEDAAWASL